MGSYWAENKSSWLQELAPHALALVNLELGYAPIKSVQYRLERTNARKQNERNIIIVKSASSFESLVQCVNNGALTPQLLLISEQLGTTFNQLWTYVTCTTSRDWINDDKVCLVQPHMKSKCPYISHLRTSIHMHNRYYHNPQKGCTNDRLNGSPRIGLGGQSPFYNCLSQHASGSHVWPRKSLP